MTGYTGPGDGPTRPTPLPDAAEKVYDGELLDVVVETWGDNRREIVEHPGSVAIVAVDREGRVALVRQLREPARAHVLELPAGTLEEGEEPLETARRELVEETGLTGGDWTHAATFWTSPGFLRERVHLFFAEGCEAGEPRPEADEAMEVVRWHVDEVPSRVGEIEDAKTLAGLLLYAERRG